MYSNRNSNGWSDFKYSIKVLKVPILSQTPKMNISLHPYYSSSWDGTSCSTSHFKMIINKKSDRKNEIQASEATKYKIFIFLQFITFFDSKVKPSFAFSPSIKSINGKTLPASTIYVKIRSRKCIQIEIRTDGATSNIQ